MLKNNFLSQTRSDFGGLNNINHFADNEGYMTK